MSIVSPIAIVIVSFEIHRRQKNRQNKIDSANLAVSIVNTWNQNKKLQEGLGILLNPDTIMDDHNSTVIIPVLNEFETVAILWRDKTLIENHAMEFFSSQIMSIKRNRSVMKHIMNVKNTKNPENPVYGNLVNLLKHLKE